MKVIEASSPAARRILIGLIVSDAVAGRIASQWQKEGLFYDRVSDLIAGWCVDYFNRYGHAPLHHIEALASGWAEGRDDGAVDEVFDFLRSLDDYEKMAKQINADLLIDEAGEHFTRCRLQHVFDAGTGYLLKGQTKKAVELVAQAVPVEMGVSGHIDPFTDREAARRVSRRKKETMIRYQDDIGRFFGLAFRRESLVAVQASAKSGKSFWLLDIAFTALQQGSKVAFFECGDLTQDQVMERILTRVAGQPLFLTEGRKREYYHVPVEMGFSEGRLVVKHDRYVLKRSLNAEDIVDLQDEFCREYKAGDLWRLSVHPARSLTVANIKGILKRWRRDGWSPDLIVCDYVDILAPMDGKADSREQINTNWIAFNAMRQELRCVVLLATQADADSYETDLIRRKNFSGDRRKNDHVTAMFALNCNDREKENGVYRLNWLDLRDEAYSERQVCHTAGCLAIAQPCILSHFKGVK